MGPVHVSPPSVDLYRPTPASLSAEALASPVPTQTVLGSLGSSAIELTALIPNEPERYFQVGSDTRASSVRHTPPPAGVAHRRQFRGTQMGEIASAVVRPPASYELGT